MGAVGSHLVTLTNATPSADPRSMSPGETARDRREAKRRRRNTIRGLMIAAFVLVVVVGGGGVAWYVASGIGELGPETAAAKTLLAASDKKVVEQGTRVGLSAEIEQADSLLAESFFTRLVTGSGETRDSLAQASGAVRASMLEFGRAEVTEARERLETSSARGEAVYTATEGKGADEAVRARLRDALDGVAGAGETVTSGLDQADLNQLQRMAADLGSNQSTVAVATKSMIAEQDPITCPAPDQVWDPESGAVPDEELVPIPWAPDFRVHEDVLDGLIKLDAAFKEEFGVHLTINSAYRTLADQTSLYDPSSPIAAPPGCSNHGLGLAVDIGGGVEAFDTTPYNWLKANAADFGWVHPDFAEPDGRVPEPWHWQSVLALQSL